MKSKFEGLKSFVQAKTGQASQSINTFVDKESTKIAIAKTKGVMAVAADEAKAQGKRIANSEMGRDAATGAAIGAAVAVPIPIIGPIFGALVGAGAGVVINLKKGDSKNNVTPENHSATAVPEIDIYKRLNDLDDLRQKGILTQDEFDLEKRKILKN